MRHKLNNFSKSQAKTKTKAKVFVVRGFVVTKDYESSDVISVCSSRIIANTAIQWELYS